MSCKTLAQDIDQSIAATFNVTTDHFVFTRDQTAYKIPFASMSASLGVTGTLNTVGSASAVNILSQPSSGINQVRSILPSYGITALLDASGSVNIRTNLANSAGSAKIIENATLPQIKFRGLTAGDGISVVQRDNDILISSATTVVTSKTVIVTQASDFPAADAGGVITFDDNTDYFLANDITTANKFAGGFKVVLRGPASQIVKLTYTGTGTMFTSTNPALRISGVSIDCPTAKAFDMSSSGTGVFQMIESTIVSCTSIGTIGTMFLVRLDGLTVSAATQGIDFTGAINILSTENFINFQSSGAVYDLGAAVFTSLSLSTNKMMSSTAVNFISGAVDSANIAVGGFATVTNCRMPATTTPLTGVSTNNARWNFTSNDEIQDTRPDSLLSLSAQTTTVITTVNVATLVLGTFTVISSAQMTATAAGRATYEGERPAALPITANLTIEPFSGTGKTISAYLAKNGTKIALSRVQSTMSATLPENLTVVWQDTFVNGDYYEIFVENNTDAINLIVKNAVLRVN
jgi:hypothetical protein